jgi:acyl CoA:acetate/3-ketoacid CoA transferase alpha subunit
VAVQLYMDVHVPQAITDQLRRRGVDVLTAIENDSGELLDGELLEHVRSLGRVLFTQDIRFKAMAEDWQCRGKPFSI